MLRIYLLSSFLFIALSCSNETKNVILSDIAFSQDDTGYKKQDSIQKYSRIKKEIKELKKYISSNKKYNSEMIFLIDMKIPSQKYRFFIYDLKNDSIQRESLVSHGSGSVISNSDSLCFSNIPESHQSSLGKYKIGNDYIGNFGKSYKLHGLDSTNSNAFKRYIVLHKYFCVPNREQLFPICTSLGCPMVSEVFFKVLENIIDSSEKPILLKIYY
ncbi:MAG: murein L,D-transpeptidase catalytic domain family protein [Flavobacteriales bacterium]|nr:murein L,D-transpeptidase catalytic domain family protein [Flavobacteriales bacterium]